MRNLKDRVVVVTGGAAGIGKALVQRFAEEGSKVVVADIDLAGANAVATEFGACAVRLDVTDPASTDATVALAVEMYGRLDVMINNAGIESPRALHHESTRETWDRVIDVDLTGVFNAMRSALAQFMAQGEGGVIVNLASLASQVAIPRIPSYSAAKAGVVGLTRAAAVDYGPHGIRVNAVAPTAIDATGTFLRSQRDEDDATIKQRLSGNPLAGIPTPHDVAAAVAFLASDDARFISGVVLPVDGARSQV